MSTLTSVKEAADVLELTPQRIRQLCNSGTLHAEKISNAWIIEKKSLTQYKKSLKPLTKDHSIKSKSKSKRPIALSFFSGAMGLDIGLEEAGFDVLLACEVDKWCRETININRPNIALIGDIRDYNKNQVLRKAGLSSRDKIDLIIGGPPCQAFSTAGNRQGFNDDRGNVFLKYLDLALALKPKYFVIENVRGLLSCPMDHRPHDQRGCGYPDLSEDELKGGALNFVISKLKRSGYAYSFNLYNAANFGSPQIRERVVIVCSRDGQTPPFLIPTYSNDKEHGLPKWKILKSCLKKIKKHDHLNFPERRLKYYRMLEPGQNWRNLPKKLQKEALGKSYYSGGGKTGFLRRLDWNKPSPTIVTHPIMPATDLAHPEEDRPLSIQEYKRIQEFPDDWELAGSLLEQYKQVGNAVPKSLGFAIGKLIIDLIHNNAILNIENFNYSRYKKTSNTEWEIEFNKHRSKHLNNTSQK